MATGTARATSDYERFQAAGECAPPPTLPPPPPDDTSNNIEDDNGEPGPDQQADDPKAKPDEPAKPVSPIDTGNHASCLCSVAVLPVLAASLSALFTLRFRSTR